MNDQPSSDAAPSGATSTASTHSASDDTSSDFHAAMSITRQYIKDLSFENPNAPAIYGKFSDEGFDIKIDVDITARAIEANIHEVVVGLNVTAGYRDTTAFIMELQYAAETRTNEDAPEDKLERALMIQVPRYLFPFLRNIVANTTRDGGFPPLLLSPINFRKIHESRRPQSAPEAVPETAKNG